MDSRADVRYAAAMEKRSVSSLNLTVSLLGFGLMRLPKIAENRQDIDYALAEQMIDRAIAGGVNYFDTAFMYHDGMSEDFAGHALSNYPRDSFFLASKLPIWKTRSPEEVERIFAEQLKKCRVDHFDFYLLHSLNRDWYAIVQDVGIYELMLRKKEQGLIRHLGFSFHDNAELMNRIVADHDWDFAQIQVNYVDWDMLDAGTLHETLTRRNIPVIVMEPVRGGALATLNPEAVEIFRQANPDASPASWAIRYAASLPNVMTVLSGMSSMEQVEDNIRTMTPFKPLSKSEREVIARAASAFLASGAIPCTGCRYCMECPAGVDIPRVFAVYNHYCVTRFATGVINNYRSLPEARQAHNCIACGECLEHCPQHIDIPGQMRHIVAVAEECAAKR